ncbi:hypothetical protein BZARG_791 [Bizionia argentinensis JUB59]|uniref:Uncharacterized protein n=1 Tax=Bizionia argentinensis JUB59 TaxID=1046627 RepID=G2EBA8_9FLAO|nr:hypothetical protein [Bizionia argentinensis]EGV44244.1 hypothetical protein BZARG_791 [Bizionia argentinensis JUB59]
MADLGDIKKLLREVVGANPNLPIPATVISVSGDTCKVKLNSGLELTDVKLKATSNGDANFVLITPKANSQVLLLSLSGGLENLTVIKVDDVEKLEYQQDGILVQVDSTTPKVLVKVAEQLEILADGTDYKVSVKNNAASLVDVMQDLADLLKQLKVFTPAGPSGTPLPDSITAITQFETKFKQLLK